MGNGPGMILDGLFGALAGAAITRVCAPRVMDMLLQTVGPVANYRGRPTAFPAGLALVLGATAGSATALAVRLGDGMCLEWAAHAACLVLILGFGLAGFTDDILGGRQYSGFCGHLGAARRGILTTGALKIVMGTVLSVAAVMLRRAGTWHCTAPAASAGNALSGAGPLFLAELLLDSALVAATANLINLLDRRPGRAIKGFALGAMAASIGIWLTRGPDELPYALSPAAGMLGAAAAFIRRDLGEQAMLGDAGSNPLGAILGFTFLSIAPAPRIMLLALIAWLTLASERISFSDVIESNRVLRFLDRLGRSDW